MSPTAELLLGLIALAVLVMAIVQVGAIVAGLRVARRLERLATDFDASIKPVVANLASISADARKTATLTATQAERLDKILGELSTGAERTISSAQQLLTGPAREGMAIIAGVRAAVAAFQALRESNRRRTAARSAASDEEEEESLFIG